MISHAPDQSWHGFEAFYVSCQNGPCYLIQVDRKELGRRLARGERLGVIVTGERDR